MKKIIIIYEFLLVSLFAFAQVPFELVTENFNSIDVGIRSKPTFTDLDGDDLIQIKDTVNHP